jgi:hypothetical protein
MRKYLLISILASVLWACNDKEEVPVLEIAQSEYDRVSALSSAGGTVDVVVTTNREISLTTDASAPWCTARHGHHVNGIAKVRIETEENSSVESRTAVLTLHAPGAPDITLPVIQTGAQPFIIVEEAADGFSVDDKEQVIMLHVSTNISVNILSPEWIVPQVGNPPGTGGIYNFNVAAMQEMGVREGKIAVSRADGSIVAKTVYVSVKQEKLAPPFNKNQWSITCDNEWAPAGTLASFLIDGQVGTGYWHTTPGVSLPHWIMVDMKENKIITGFYFQHRLDGGGEGNPKALRIEINSDGAAWETVYETNDLVQTKDRISLPLAKSVSARYFRITITATQGNSDYTYFDEISAYNDVEF